MSRRLGINIQRPTLNITRRERSQCRAARYDHAQPPKKRMRLRRCGRLRLPVKDPAAVQAGGDLLRSAYGVDDVGLRLHVAALADLVGKGRDGDAVFFVK